MITRYKRFACILLALLSLFILSCSFEQAVKETATFDAPAISDAIHEISPEEAASMMKAVDGHIVLDARDSKAYAAGHIPGAICLGTENVDRRVESMLSGPDQVVLIYGSNADQSRNAAQNLCELGYCNVYVFGGINDWYGVLAQGDQPGVFRGYKSSHELLIFIGTKTFEVETEESIAVNDLLSRFAESSLMLLMTDRDGVQKSAKMPWKIDGQEQTVDAYPGDILLYEDDTISICYEYTSGTFTRIGHIIGPTVSELKALLGEGDISVVFQTEP